LFPTGARLWQNSWLYMFSYLH